MNCSPVRSTSVGASAIALSGRFAIAPRLGMLPYTTLGLPVTIEWMIVLPYSWLRCTSIGASLRLKVFIRSNSVDDAVAAPQVFVDRHIVFRDAFRAVRDEIRAVFRVVLGLIR